MATQRGGIPGLEGISELFEEIFDDDEVEEELTEQSLLPFGVGGDAKEIHSSLPFGIGSRPTTGPTQIMIPHDPFLDEESESQSELEPDLEPVVETSTIVEEFSRFDTDESGTISVEEIADVTGLEEEQAKILHSDIDIDGDGEISIEEFKQAAKTQSLAEKLGIPMIKARPVADESTETTKPESSSKYVPEPVSVPEPVPSVANMDEESPESILLGGSGSHIFTPPKLRDEELLILYEGENDVVEYHHAGDDFVSEVVVEHDNGIAQAVSQRHALELHPAKAMVVQATIDTRELIRNGFIQMSSSDWHTACATFQGLAQQMPEDSAVQNNLGLCFLQIALSEQGPRSQQSFENSITTLRNAAKANPSELPILVNLAQALLLSGRSDKALRVIEAVLQRDSGHCEALNLHAAILFDLDRIPEAKRSLGIIVETDDVIISNLRLLQAV